MAAVNMKGREPLPPLWMEHKPPRDWLVPTIAVACAFAGALIYVLAPYIYH